MVELMNKMNIDLENRKRGLETYPFEKQCDLANMHPQLVTDHAECFYLSADYYPEGKFDVENIPALIARITEVKENHIANRNAEPAFVEPNEVLPEMMVEEQPEVVSPEMMVEQPPVKTLN